MARFRFGPGKLATGAALGAVTLALTATPAFAATAPGTNLLQNPSFAPPDQTANTNPPGWDLAFLGAETNPYGAQINSYDATGQYPPPAGDPDPSGIGDEIYYEAGSATGIEGIGAEQTASTFGTVTQADDPQVSYSAVETNSPEASVAAWAGSIYEVDVTSGGQDYSLIYYNPWQAYNSTFSGTPTDSATTKYITGPALAPKTWYTQSPRDLNADLQSEFGLASYTVDDVIAGTLEDTTSSAYPYPNMTGYVADVALTEGSGAPSPNLPESPLTIGMPLAAIGIFGAGAVILRRRRATARG